MQKSIVPLVFLICSLLFLNNPPSCFFRQVHASETTEPPANNGSLKFKLIHRHSPELAHLGPNLGPPRSERERMQQLIQSDDARVHAISQKLLARRSDMQLKVWETLDLVEVPMRSAAALGKGQYFVSLRIGTPPKRAVLIADTGSSITWMKCKYKGDDESAKFEGRIYYANASRTFKPVPCSSDVCKRLPSVKDHQCASPMDPCDYELSYLGGSIIRGIYGNETVKLRSSNGKKIKMTNMLIGCTESIEGDSLNEFDSMDGVMGLGIVPYSFAYQGATTFGGKFAYCLVDRFSPPNVVNYLVFGKVYKSRLPFMHYTVLGVAGECLYTVNVTGISVDGKMLDIPSYAWATTVDNDLNNEGFGIISNTILDSGHSLALLVQPAFEKLQAAFNASLSRFHRVETTRPDMPDYCFNATGYEESLMPKLAFHFWDGTKFAPPVKNYVIDENSMDNVKCLAIRSTELAPGNTNIIGNIMQQNHIWEFDYVNGRLGFAASNCTFD